MAGINDSVTQNLLPVQAYFNLDGTFNTFIGQNMPFYATTNPIQSGLTITNSTIDSTTIGVTTPSTGVFTNITTTTGQITTQPSGATDIVNLLALQSYAVGISWKQPVACATTANITLSGLQTIDTYTTLSGDRVIVKNQTTSANNGIYIASSGAWTRSTDANTWNELVSAIAFIEYGSQAGGAWFCTVTPGGTLGVTPVTWAKFATSATYSAGTGLSLTGYTFSITNIGTAGTYGSASSVPVFTTNAQGQVTSVTNTSIAIANTQVSGLGTMSTQNANNVAITGGSINGTTIGDSTASAITGTTITANSSFSGPGTGLTGNASALSIGGSAASATTAGSVTNSITFNNGGTGAASGTTFNGSVAQTISYNTIGAPSTTGTGASGSWGISITGNAATVTNGVYTTGSYSNPSWITSILGSIVSGAVTSATTSTNLSGGLAGSLPYQSGAGATTFLGIGSANYVLTSTGSAPQYVAQSTLSVGSASTATTATNLAGGIASQIPYQTAAGTTAFVANGTTGQFLTSNGTSAPSWSSVATSVTIVDQTSSSSTFYPLFYSATSGSTNTVETSSTKLQYVPSTGTFTSTVFSGSGASLTNIPNSALTNSSFTLGSTSIALGSTTTTIDGLSSVTSTTFVGALTGNASTATTATTATNATNIGITDNTSSSATWYPTIVSNTTGNLPATTSSTKLSFVPSTGTLNATVFSGSFTGSWAGSVVTVPYGGTGLSSLTANYIPYGNGTSAFQSSSNLQFTGTNLLLAQSYDQGTGVLQVTGQSTFTGSVTDKSLYLQGGNNLLTYSQDFTNAAWTKISSTVTNSSTTAPDGTATGQTLTTTSGGTYHYAYRSAPPTISGSNTFSIFVKQGTATWIWFSVRDNSFNYFNVSTGAFGTTPDSCTVSALANGWYRITTTKVETSGTNSIGIANSNGGASFSAAGTETVFIWGSQLEIGTVASAYTPTTTVAITTTNNISVPSGQVLVQTGSISTPSIGFSNFASNQAGIYSSSNNILDIVASGATQARFSNNGNFFTGPQISLTSTSSLNWSSGVAGASSGDTFLYRDAANTLAQRNSTNAQTFRLYNTYTSTSLGEWLSVDWSTTANTATIATKANGAGVVRTLATGNPLVISTGYTVATLPTGVVGMRAYVTDALAPSYSATAVGGGTVKIPVFYNGTAWICA